MGVVGVVLYRANFMVLISLIQYALLCEGRALPSAEAWVALRPRCRGMTASAAIPWLDCVATGHSKPGQRSAGLTRRVSGLNHPDHLRCAEAVSSASRPHFDGV